MQTKTKRKSGSALTTKGQVTLPKSMRDAFGWKPGTRIAFVREKDGIKLVVAGKDDPGGALVRRSRGIASVRLTTGQIMRMTRGDD